MVPASANHQFSVHVCGALRSRQSVEQFFAAVEGGDQAAQIVGSDGLLVVDVEFEAVIARVKEHYALRSPALAEDEDRGLDAG
jgi:hypothetical protein